MSAFDVCVIGSGAAGGIVTKTLCEAGAKVCLIEAGQRLRHADSKGHCWPWDLEFRGLKGEKQQLLYPKDLKNTVRYQGAPNVKVDRIRVLGGRTMHWNAVVLRFAPQDFLEYSTNGIENDWPITYQELEPFYERIESMIGVCGQDDQLEILPAGKSYLPILPWRCSEHDLAAACEKAGRKLIPVRKAVLTKNYDRRPKCHFCGHCMEGCDVSSNKDHDHSGLLSFTGGHAGGFEV
jgi:choline dehydrogenase-like flavoprotein